MPIPQTVNENGHITYHPNAEQTAFFDDVISRPISERPRMMELLNKTPIWARNADENDGL